MRKDKQIAIQLRKEGNSYSQIRDTLGVSKSTLSYWLRNLKISKNARRKISARAHKISIAALIERNKNQTALAKERAERIRLEARQEVSKSSKRKRNPNSLIYGTIHIRICDVKLFFRIIGWIDGLKEKLA